MADTSLSVPRSSRSIIIINANSQATPPRSHPLPQPASHPNSTIQVPRSQSQDLITPDSKQDYAPAFHAEVKVAFVLAQSGQEDQGSLVEDSTKDILGQGTAVDGANLPHQSLLFRLVDHQSSVPPDNTVTPPSMPPEGSRKRGPGVVGSHPSQIQAGIQTEATGNGIAQSPTNPPAATISGSASVLRQKRLARTAPIFQNNPLTPGMASGQIQAAPPVSTKQNRVVPPPTTKQSKVNTTAPTTLVLESASRQSSGLSSNPLEPLPIMPQLPRSLALSRVHDNKQSGEGPGPGARKTPSEKMKSTPAGRSPVNVTKKLSALSGNSKQHVLPKTAESVVVVVPESNLFDLPNDPPGSPGKEMKPNVAPCKASAVANKRNRGSDGQKSRVIVGRNGSDDDDNDAYDARRPRAPTSHCRATRASLNSGPLLELPLNNNNKAPQKQRDASSKKGKESVESTNVLSGNQVNTGILAMEGGRGLRIVAQKATTQPHPESIEEFEGRMTSVAENQDVELQPRPESLPCNVTDAASPRIRNGPPDRIHSDHIRPLQNEQDNTSPRHECQVNDRPTVDQSKHIKSKEQPKGDSDRSIGRTATKLLLGSMQEAPIEIDDAGSETSDVPGYTKIPLDQVDQDGHWSEPGHPFNSHSLADGTPLMALNEPTSDFHEHDIRAAEVADGIRKPNIVHFSQDGPKNQGILPGKQALHTAVLPARAHKPAEIRETPVKNSFRLQSNSPAIEALQEIMTLSTLRGKNQGNFKGITAMHSEYPATRSGVEGPGEGLPVTMVTDTGRRLEDRDSITRAPQQPGSLENGGVGLQVKDVVNTRPSEYTETTNREAKASSGHSTSHQSSQDGLHQVMKSAKVGRPDLQTKDQDRSLPSARVPTSSHIRAAAEIPTRPEGLTPQALIPHAQHTVQAAPTENSNPGQHTSPGYSDRTPICRKLVISPQAGTKRQGDVVAGARKKRTKTVGNGLPQSKLGVTLHKDTANIPKSSQRTITIEGSPIAQAQQEQYARQQEASEEPTENLENNDSEPVIYTPQVALENALNEDDPFMAWPGDEKAEAFAFQHDEGSFLGQIRSDARRQRAGADQAHQQTAPEGAGNEEDTDPDETLVEAEEPKLIHGGEGDSSSRSSDSDDSGHVDGSPDDILGEWQHAMQPHQRSVADSIFRVAHDLVRHLIDTETAITDIVKDYQDDCLMLIREMEKSHTQKLGQYLQSAQGAGKELAEGFRRTAACLEKDLATVRTSAEENKKKKQNGTADSIKQLRDLMGGFV